jgi:hypothetical protein
MCVRPVKFTRMSVLSIIHVRPSCVSYMYVRSKYPTCKILMDDVHVRYTGRCTCKIIWIDVHVRCTGRTYILDTLSIFHVSPFEYLTFTSVMSILHVCPSCVSKMYVRPEYLTCMSVLGILRCDVHVRYLLRPYR